ncbi:MAG: hypothetical protein J6Z22_05355 [Lachnospiraceae bacterium]|nr:hypothetical protein [Lachnospiraceae bacterium]
MMEQKTKCKKCLIRELAEQQDLWKTLQRMIEDLNPEERADEALREERLGICKQCERLMEGMCTACGCYVELRTATRDQECPYERW